MFRLSNALSALKICKPKIRSTQNKYFTNYKQNYSHAVKPDEKFSIDDATIEIITKPVPIENEIIQPKYKKYYLTDQQIKLLQQLELKTQNEQTISSNNCAAVTQLKPLAFVDKLYIFIICVFAFIVLMWFLCILMITFKFVIIWCHDIVNFFK